MLSIALLGPVEVRREGELLAVPAGKPTELLVRLALVAGTMVPKERLLEDLWADDAVATAPNTIQSKVSRLRKALGDPGLVVGGPVGYTLAVDARAVDALEVARLAGEVDARREARDPAGVVEHASVALALFRGELFGASDADWLQPHRAQLDGLRLRLVEDRLRARLDLGDGADLVGELESLTAAHPLREELWGLLMTALYRAGRQADALAAYRRVREHLVDELGIDPGRELQRLEQQILEQDPALDAPDRRAPSARPAAGGNLPPLASSLVGREREAADVADRLAAHRLVTLVGPAGVGKTRLALEVARRVEPADGAWLVRLDTARADTMVADTIAVALNTTDLEAAALAERLRGATVLLVLDNCEHVVDAVADLVGPLLRAGPDVRILATSQLPLGVDGEEVLPVEPLSFDDAVELFARRAREQGQVPLDGDGAATIEAVCRALDGLPLAIELAAARTKSLSLAEISRRLGDRFTLLRDPTSRKPERQRTLSAAIAWSYDLLFPDDQRGLWALAAFVGGAPLAGVERVLAALDVPDEAAIDVVGRLVDRSLVTVERKPDGTARYGLLDSVRSYALARLEESGHAPAVHRARTAWIADSASLREGEVPTGLVGFARDERHNIDAALAWTATHDPALGLELAVSLGWAWIVLGDASAALRLRAALDAAAAAGPVERRVAGLLLLAWLQASAGDVDLARAALDDAVAALAGIDDPYLSARADFFEAYVSSQKAEFRDALRLLDRARPVFAGLDRPWDEAGAWVLTAHVALATGDAPAAAHACAEAGRLLEVAGDPWFEVHAEAMLGAVAQSEHRFADACGHLGRAADAAQRQGFAATEAYHRANLGRAQQQAGELDDAAASLREAIEVARGTGDLRVAALGRLRLGRVLRELGDDDGARTNALAAQAWYRASGGGDHALLADCLVASLDAGDATDALERVLAEARRVGDPEVEVLALDALARRAATAGDDARATALLDEADAAMPTARLRVTDRDRVDARAIRPRAGAR